MINQIGPRSNGVCKLAFRVKEETQDQRGLAGGQGVQEPQDLSEHLEVQGQRGDQVISIADNSQQIGV